MIPFRHKWRQDTFAHWTCEKCGCEKVRNNGNTWYVTHKQSLVRPQCIGMNEKPFKIQ
jgi:hypothetical protein